MKTNKIIICSSCTPEVASEKHSSLQEFTALLENALDAAGLAEEFEVGLVECMGACENPVAVAIQGQGRATYLFAGVEPANDSQDIIQTCKSYLATTDGWIEDARSCGRLRELLRSRVPALNRD
ncbi:MAG: DUF1636 family protein [Rhizobiaceae bacterium]